MATHKRRKAALKAWDTMRSPDWEGRSAKLTLHPCELNRVGFRVDTYRHGKKTGRIEANCAGLDAYLGKKRVARLYWDRLFDLLAANNS